jgi:uncharacterized protein (TIGR00156 family)
MKKISTLALLGLMVGGSAIAGPTSMNNDMNNDNTMTVMTVEEVRGLSDNSPVVVRGYLLRQNGENSYIFQDNTGTINMEIDEEDWNGVTVSPTDMVEIWGEVDKNGMAVMEIDVSAIKKM